MPRVCVLMAQGYEEMELVITVDVLRRAGVTVDIVTINETTDPVLGSRQIRMVPDLVLSRIDVTQYDGVVLPGGIEGTERLGKCSGVLDLIRTMINGGKLIAAICAAPTILAEAGLMDGRRITCHPGAVGGVKRAVLETHRVVTDGQFVTSRAAGTTFEFAFKLVERLTGPEKVREVNRGVLALLPEALPALLA